jgi:hypothetical protein
VSARAGGDPEPAVPLPNLIDQLGDDDYDTREAAGRRLVQMGEAALPGLDSAMQHSTDAEIRRQAHELARVIRTALRERQVNAILEEVNAIGLDRFIERMVKEKDFATEERWAKMIELGMAVGERASEFAGPEFAGWRHVAKLPVLHGFNEGGRVDGRALLDGLDDGRPQIHNAVVLSTRMSGRLRVISGSIVFINGDLDHATSIDSSIIICNGDIQDVYYLRHSVVLATGRVGRVRSLISSVVQAKSVDSCYDSRGGVYLNLAKSPADEDSGDLILKTTRGPLDLFRFSNRTEAPAERRERER